MRRDPSRVPADLRALHVTTAEWELERVVEFIEDQPEPFNPYNTVDLSCELIREVADMFVGFGWLRKLDWANVPHYIRADRAADFPEPVLTLYRCYTAAGDLLYIGCTSKAVVTRLAAHSAKPWWPEVARVDEQRVTGWQAAWRAEAEAIAAENPRHNKIRTLAAVAS